MLATQRNTVWKEILDPEVKLLISGFIIFIAQAAGVAFMILIMVNPDSALKKGIMQYLR